MTPQYLYWVCEKFKFLSYLGWENSSFGIVRMNLPNYFAHILIVHRTKLLNVISVVEFQRWWVLQCKILEPVCCKKWQKKSQPKNCVVNSGHLKVLKDTKLVLNEHELPLNHLGSIWYLTKPSDVHYSPS